MPFIHKLVWLYACFFSCDYSAFPNPQQIFFFSFLLLPRAFSAFSSFVGDRRNVHAVNSAHNSKLLSSLLVKRKISATKVCLQNLKDYCHCGVFIFQSLSSSSMNSLWEQSVGEKFFACCSFKIYIQCVILIWNLLGVKIIV